MISSAIEPVNGVATVIIQGDRNRNSKHARPARMLKSRVALQDFWTPLNKTNLIDSPVFSHVIIKLFLGLVNSQVHSPDQIGRYVHQERERYSSRVRDVGTVAPASAPAYTVVTANGKTRVLVSINRQPDSNNGGSRQRSQSGNPKDSSLASRRRGVERLYDQSNIVRDQLAACVTPSSSAFARRVHYLAFPARWGTALMTGLVIPVAIFVTFNRHEILGQSFNMMTLGGLAAAGVSLSMMRSSSLRTLCSIATWRRPLKRLPAPLKELTSARWVNAYSHRRFLPLITITVSLDILSRPGDFHERVIAYIAGTGANLVDEPWEFT